MNKQRLMFRAYLLCFFGFFGIAGLHHLLFGNYIRAIIYFFTGGLFVIGTIIDLFLIPRMVEKKSKSNLVDQLDITILTLCRSKRETTLSDLVIQTQAPPNEIKQILDQLCRQGLLTLDNRESDGAIIYKTI